MFFLSSKDHERESTLATWGLLILFFTLASIPFLEFGFSGDDIFNSQIKGMLITSHTALIEFTLDIIKGWIYAGRLYPIPFLTNNPLFYLIGDNLILYNVIHWIATIISLSFASLLLYKLTKRKDLILLFWSLFPFCWSLIPTSPWVAQGLLLPLIISFIMLALINYINFIQLNKIKHFIYLHVFLILGLLTYEIALVIPPIILILNFWLKPADFQRKLMATSSVCLITIIYFAITFFIRRHFQVGYIGTSLGDISAFPLTFLKQLIGELPFMNVVYLYEHLFYFPIANNTYFIAVLLFFLSTTLIFTQLKKTSPIEGSKWLIMIGLVLQLLPAGLIGLSKRYQFELVFGLSHIPVILQQIGLCMMLALAINNFFVWLVQDHYAIYIKGLIAMLIGSVIGLGFIGNQATASWFNQVNRYSRDIYEKSIKNGLFDTLPPKAIILKAPAGSEMLWNSTKLRAQLANRGDILLFDLNNGEAPVLDKEYEKIFSTRFSNVTENNLYYLDVSHLKNAPESGYAMLCHIKNHTGSPPHLSLQLDKIKIFYFAKSKKVFKKILGEIADKYKTIDIKYLNVSSNRPPNLSGDVLLSSSISFNT